MQSLLSKSLPQLSSMSGAELAQALQGLGKVQVHPTERWMTRTLRALAANASSTDEIQCARSLAVLHGLMQQRPAVSGAAGDAEQALKAAFGKQLEELFNHQPVELQASLTQLRDAASAAKAVAASTAAAAAAPAGIDSNPSPSPSPEESSDAALAATTSSESGDSSGDQLDAAAAGTEETEVQSAGLLGASEPDSGSSAVAGASSSSGVAHKAAATSAAATAAESPAMPRSALSQDEAARLLHALASAAAATRSAVSSSNGAVTTSHSALGKCHQEWMDALVDACQLSIRRIRPRGLAEYVWALGQLKSGATAASGPLEKGPSGVPAAAGAVKAPHRRPRLTGGMLAAVGKQAVFAMRNMSGPELALLGQGLWQIDYAANQRFRQAYAGSSDTSFPFVCTTKAMSELAY